MLTLLINYEDIFLGEDREVIKGEVELRDTTVEEVNSLVKAASEGPMSGVLGYNDAPLVSIDFNHNPNSSIFDAGLTRVMEGNLVKVLSWYDNEWGFSNRMLDTTIAMVNA